MRYHVAEYHPGRRVVFQFAADGLTGGLDGRHFFEVVPSGITPSFAMWLTRSATWIRG